MTFDESPPPVCCRENRRSAVDPCWDYAQSSILCYIKILSLSLGGLCPVSVTDESRDAHCVAFYSLMGILCGVREKERHLASYHGSHAACREINVIKVAPWPASIWHWRRKEGERADPATCALRQDTWRNILSQRCTAASCSHSSFDLLSHHCGLLSLIFLEVRWYQGSTVVLTHQA